MALWASPVSIRMRQGYTLTHLYDALAVAKQAFDGVHAGEITRQTSKKGETYYTWSLEVPEDYALPSSALPGSALPGSALPWLR